MLTDEMRLITHITLKKIISSKKIYCKESPINSFTVSPTVGEKFFALAYDHHPLFTPSQQFHLIRLYSFLNSL
jgi:hypothetical protein